MSRRDVRAFVLALLCLVCMALWTARAAAQAPPDDDPRSLGDPAAPVVIVEYSDYECPACASFVRDTKPQLIADYVETGKVRYVYRDNPLPQHPAGRVAAAYARCAAQQGQFWPMHRRLFQGYIDSEWGGAPAAAERVFQAYGRDLGLDAGALQRCVADPATDRAIAADVEEARNRGLRGTPGYVLRWPGGPERGDVLTGAQSFGTWRYLLDERLNGRSVAQNGAGDAQSTDASVILYLGLGVAGGLLVLLAGGGVLWWLAARNRRPPASGA